VVTQCLYNAFNIKLRQVYDVGGLNFTQQWSLDTMSRVIAYTDPTGQISTYQFDSVGRPIGVTYPNGFVSTRTFNDHNQVVQETTGSGAAHTYTYDAANRLKTVVNSSAPAPLQAVNPHEFTYDGLDRVTKAKVGADEILRSYDSQGRLLTETTLGSTISCRYDDAAGEVEKTWPDGRKEVLSHDLNGTLASITQSAIGALGAGIGQIATFRPSGVGALGDVAYRGGTSLTNTYDDRKRLTEIVVTSPAGLNERLKYRYDSDGRRRVEAIAGQAPKTSYFEFDARNRLRLVREGFAVAVPNATTQAEHDAAVAAVQAASAAARR
jgi:YD repeat-containing protein